MNVDMKRTVWALVTSAGRPGQAFTGHEVPLARDTVVWQRNRLESLSEGPRSIAMAET